MKYSRLSKEQFESLHEEFALFLASQSINKVEWDKIKMDPSKLTEELLDLFSDLVWEESLEKITYLENRSDHHLFLFKCIDACIDLILIQLETDCPSLLQKDYKHWLAKHLTDPRVSIFESSRIFDENFKEEKFKLIRKGASVTDGVTYEDIKSFLSK
jgi:hypothetical protein